MIVLRAQLDSQGGDRCGIQAMGLGIHGTQRDIDAGPQQWLQSWVMRVAHALAHQKQSGVFPTGDGEIERRLYSCEVIPVPFTLWRGCKQDRKQSLMRGRLG